MSKKKYLIRKLDAKVIAQKLKLKHSEESNALDFQSEMLRKQLILAECICNENAMLYQLAQCKKCPPKGENEAERFLKVLLELDFKEVFRNDSVKYEDQVKELFESGFQIQYADDETITYLPFDKSASMSRESRIYFIAKDFEKDRPETLKEEIDKRLLLGLWFDKIKIQDKSKFFGYRGLYLSDADRIEQKSNEFELNEKTVIVIQDDCYALCPNKEKANVSNNEFIRANPNYIIENKKADTRTMINPFDGEGLISPEYTDYINKQLRITNHPASSFQIRMPFTKGVVHKVDFQEFFKDIYTRLGTSYEDEELKITDVFGIKRKLSEAKMILTQSMFKCTKWMKQMKKLELGTDEFNEFKQDPMQYFFNQMKKYHHTLYISGTNLPYSENKFTNLNYQYLNPLDISKNELRLIKKKCLDSITIKSADWEMTQQIQKHKIEIKESEDSGTQPAQESEETASAAAKLSANQKLQKARLICGKDFLDYKKYRKTLFDKMYSRAKDCCIGRLRVCGERRYLSADLLALLKFILLISDLPDEHKKTVKKIRTLFRGKFYMPNPNIRLSPTKSYVILRNPHLSRNEECLMVPYIPTSHSTDDVFENSDYWYKTYLSDLKGVIMVPRFALEPMTMGGADFDGDTVSIIAEQSIREAVERSVYTKKEQENYRQKNWFIREKPWIGFGLKFKSDKKNTDTPPQNTEYTASIPFETVKNTFSNSIGIISNYAIRQGQYEYFHDADLKEIQETDFLEMVLKSRCTTATTEEEFIKLKQDILKKIPDELRSDAAKKFKKVTLNNNNKEISTRNPTCAECSVITGIEIDAAKTGIHPKELLKPISELNFALKNGKKDFLDYTKKISSTPLSMLTSILTRLDDKEEQTSSLDEYLKPSFAKLDVLRESLKDDFKRIKNQKDDCKEKKLKDFFRYENKTDTEDFKLVDDMARAYYELMPYINQQQKIIREQRERKFLNRQSEFVGYILHIERKQYGSVENVLNGKTIEALNDVILELLEKHISDKKATQDAWLQDDCLLTEKETRKNKLGQIIFGDTKPNDDCTDWDAVAEILCNFRKDGYRLLLYFLEVADISPKTKNTDTPEKEPELKPSVLEQYQKLKEKYIEIQKHNIWEDELAEFCLDSLTQEMEMDTVVDCVLSLTDQKIEEKFFWDILPWEEIEKRAKKGGEYNAE